MTKLDAQEIRGPDGPLLIGRGERLGEKLAGNFKKYDIPLCERRTVNVTPSAAGNAATGPAALTLSSPNLPEIRGFEAALLSGN
jgi:hypothetical protein